MADPITLAKLARDLSEQKRIFARGLAEGLNQTQAARRAKSKRPDQMGCRWAKDPAVIAYRDGILQEVRARAQADQEARLARKAEQDVVTAQVAPVKALARASEVAEGDIMTAAEVQARLSRLGRADIGRHLAIDERGQAHVKVDPTDTYTVRELTSDVILGEEGEASVVRTRVKVADPVPALQTLARIHGIEKDPAARGGVVVTGPVLVQMLGVQTEPGAFGRAAKALLGGRDGEA